MVKYRELRVDVLEVTDRIVFSGTTPVIQVKGPVKNPLKIQFLDRDDVPTHEFIINDSGAGDIRHNGRIRRVT